MSTTTEGWPVALTIAGSDSGGGAGVQADLKTFQALGVFGCSAITAVTAQHTRGVTRVDTIPVDGLIAQLRAVFDDLPVRAVKIGMLGTAAHVGAVAELLASLPSRPPIVLDPVMVATSGDRLLDEDAVRVLARDLLPLATVSTPNLAEAELLAGATGRAALEAWAATAPCALLLTGGDEGLPEVQDTLFEAGSVHRWRAPRRAGLFHGTGCTLSSAIAARLALGDDLTWACESAVRYVQGLVSRSFAPGRGARVLPHGLA
jgi:hydroxymethylpyrimidine/phosphomethylpyrimidine kinase